MIWTLTDGGAGHAIQANGLAERIAAPDKSAVRPQIVRAPKWANILPPSCAAMLRLFHISGEMNEKPDIVVCCGGKSQAAALAVKKQFGAFAVCIQRPRGSERMFDAVVAPRHDYSEKELENISQTPDGNVFATLGSVGAVNPEVLASRRESARQKFSHIPNPKTAVLVGGENRAFVMTPEVCRSFAEEVLRADGGFLVSTSRRTGNENRQALAESFNGENCFFYDGEGGENPYPDILACAERLLITADSVNMISEACAAQKPVYIVKLPQKSTRAAKKFLRFHQEVIERGLAREWRGEFETWTPPPFDETIRAAEFVRVRYERAKKESSAVRG